MTDRMIEVLVRTEPAYRDLLGHGEDEMRTTTRANLERGLQVLIGAVSGTGGTSLGPARAAARRRPARGSPRAAVRGPTGWGGPLPWEPLRASPRRNSRAPDAL